MNVIEWLDEAKASAEQWPAGIDRLNFVTRLLYAFADVVAEETPINRRDEVIVGLNRTEVVLLRLESAGAEPIERHLPDIPPRIATLVLSTIARWMADVALESVVQPCREGCVGIDEFHWLGIYDQGALGCDEAEHCALGAAVSAEAFVVACQWVVWFELCWFED